MPGEHVRSEHIREMASPTEFRWFRNPTDERFVCSVPPDKVLELYGDGRVFVRGVDGEMHEVDPRAVPYLRKFGVDFGVSFEDAAEATARMTSDELTDSPYDGSPSVHGSGTDG